MMGRKFRPPNLVVGADRFKAMDEQGIDIEALSINPFWYHAERDMARSGHQAAEREACRAVSQRIPTASSPSPRSRCSIPTSRSSSSKTASRSSACAAWRSAAASRARSSPIRSSTRSGPRPRSSACLIFMHPLGTRRAGAAPATATAGSTNTIGNPLETTIALSHLIFEGTLDRFPGLKICAAHGGGYLPSYAARSDAGLRHLPGPLRQRPLKKKPTEYLKQLYYDSHRVHAGGAAAPDRRGRRRPDHDGHRLSVPVDEHVGRPHPQHAGAERRRPNRDARRHRGAAARHQTELAAAPNETAHVCVRHAPCKP